MSALNVNTNHMSHHEFVALTSFRWAPGPLQAQWERGCDHVQDAANYLRAGLRPAPRRAIEARATVLG